MNSKQRVVIMESIGFLYDDAFNFPILSRSVTLKGTSAFDLKFFCIPNSRINSVLVCYGRIL